MWVAVAAGVAAGLLSGLLPGLHMNTVCAIALALLPGAGPAGAIALAAAGTAHAFSSILTATYLGVPGEETLASALPAHRLLLDGRGPEAVRTSVAGALAGLAAGVLLVLPYKWVLLEPGEVLAWTDRHLTTLLIALIVVLVARAARRGWAAAAAAAGLLALSGALGLTSLHWNVKALVPVAATPLLPLLSGLFGAPALLDGLRAGTEVPVQAHSLTTCRVRLAPVAAGVLASAATAILPGLTSSVATALARSGSRDRDPRGVLATQGAISTSHLLFSLVLLWTTLRTRTGLAAALQAFWPTSSWSMGSPGVQPLEVLQACLVGGTTAAVATLALDRVARRVMPRLSGRVVAGTALLLTIAVVLVLSGWWGLLLFGAAGCIGLLPARSGVGRLYLTGVLLVPVLAGRLGFNA